jgi:hypothetical protein
MSTAPTHVEVELNYTANTGERPVSYTFTPPEGVPQRSGIIEKQRVRVQNARLERELPALDRNGFQLIRHATALRDFSDEATIRELYYPEVRQLLQRETGASKVVVFDHTLRNAQPGHAQEGVREPVPYVHNDQTFVSGPRRVRDHLSAEEASQRLGKRHAIINVWRPIGTPVLNWPLALCDARSIDHNDLIASDLVYRDKVGETYAFSPNPAHSWFYYPELQLDEVVLLKIYDSNTDGTARLTAHTAFQDPTSSADAPARRSIEVRTLVFWD